MSSELLEAIIIYIMLVVIIAAVIANTKVSTMKKKLMTGTRNERAGSYIRENSLQMEVEEDYYKYTTKTRRKVETTQTNGIKRG